MCFHSTMTGMEKVLLLDQPLLKTLVTVINGPFCVPPTLLLQYCGQCYSLCFVCRSIQEEPVDIETVDENKLTISEIMAAANRSLLESQ